jgi:NhaA family Na+:H+ antiporter
MASQAPARLMPPVSERDHQKGPAEAPVVLLEYGDYECPYCGRADQIVQELQEHLDREIRYVFRHFPITTTHRHAQKAAEAAEAAGAQGKFWQMHHLLFKHQDALAEDDLVGYAAQIGLDVDRFRRELQEGVYAERVRDDFLSGVRSGANGTPTFFIDDLRYDGAWDLESLMEAIEKPLGRRVSSLAQEFTRLAASGGIMLIIATLVALLWANSPWSGAYFHFWETELAFSLGSFTFSESLLEWVNDALMVIFFFVVGLEIKREITTGELASPRRAAMPLAAALGGMVMPALIYLAFNAGGPGATGWGIPMATDIAFTLGLLTLLGTRVPFSLKVFFTALAIADDLGAVLVIAIAYTSGISWASLAVGAIFLLALVGLNRARVYATLPYALLGIGLWLAFLASGIHSTIAGVLLALTIPTRSPPNTRGLLAQVVSLLEGYNLPSEWRAAGAESHHQATLNTLEVVADRMRSPAQRLEHDLNPWSTYLILPLFALANAGVVLGGGGAGATGGPSPFNPVSLGILCGLVLGKPLGISLFSWLAVRLGWADMPSGVAWAQLFSASWLAGIGFTISLFITNTAFNDAGLQATAKLAILLASLLAAGLGSGLLLLTSPSYEEVTQMEAVPAGD